MNRVVLYLRRGATHIWRNLLHIPIRSRLQLLTSFGYRET